MEYLKKHKKTIFIILAVIAVLGILWAITRNPNVSGDSTSGKSLAKCLRDKGAKFYGSSRCPHCTSQKSMFGADAGDLPYVECLSPSGGQSKECSDAGVTAYPMWKFADGKTLSGSIPLDQLRQASGC